METQLQNKPLLTVIGGPPGSGKNTLYNQVLKPELAQMPVVDPDLVMQDIPKYQSLMRVNPVAAFERYEIPARLKAQAMANEALERKSSIVYIRVLAMEDCMKFLQNAAKRGFQIVMHLCLCAKALCMARVAHRSSTTKQYLSPEIVNERYDAFMGRYDDIIAHAHQLSLWDATNTFKKIQAFEPPLVHA